jgi:hypothetical protein
MWKMTLIIMSGLVLLSLGSLYIGPKVFSSYEHSLDGQLSQAEQTSPQTAEAIRKRVQIRKARLAVSSFDLVGGLTSHELETIPTLNLAFPFFYLLACFWLILGLRKPKRE